VAHVLFAGADVRVDPELPDAAWDRSRRELYLLRPDVARPLSVDTSVWPRPESVAGELGDSLPWVGAEAVRRRWATSPAGRSDRSVVVALGVVAADTRARQILAQQRGIDTEVTVGPSWRFLGFDIVDGGISGLSNCGFDEAERGGLRARWGRRLNDHGLFTELSDAISFKAVTDKRVPEHAPFEVWGIWIVA